MFGLAVTDLIQELYPYLRVGPASVCLLCTISPPRLGLISHGNYTETERSYETQRYAGRDVKPSLIAV